MKQQSIYVGYALIILAFCVSTASAQKATDRWLRVMTTEESLIDVERTSLVLESGSTIRATFRTTLAAPEVISGKPGLQYQTRIDQIEFNIIKNRYRIFQSDFIDGNMEKISSISANSDDGWRPMAGNTAYKLRSAAEQLAPFGSWKIATYHYPTGESPSDSDPVEIKSLIGSNISISIYETAIAPTKCSVREFEPLTVDNEKSIRLFGSPLSALKISSDHVDSIRFRCAVGDKTSTAYLLRLPSEKALLLWNGVFLEIERPGNPFLP